MAFFVSTAHCSTLPLPLQARMITRPETVPQHIAVAFDPVEYLTRELAPLSATTVQAVASVNPDGAKALETSWPRRPMLTLCPVRGFMVTPTPSFLEHLVPAPMVSETCGAHSERKKGSSEIDRRRAAYKVALGRPKDVKCAAITESGTVAVTKHSLSLHKPSD